MSEFRVLPHRVREFTENRRFFREFTDSPQRDLGCVFKYFDTFVVDGRLSWV